MSNSGQVLSLPLAVSLFNSSANLSRLFNSSGTDLLLNSRHPLAVVLGSPPQRRAGKAADPARFTFNESCKPGPGNGRRSAPDHDAPVVVEEMMVAGKAVDMLAVVVPAKAVVVRTIR